MGIEGINIKNFQPVPKARGTAAAQAVLFVVPSLVITVASIFLFQLLQGFTELQQNIFSVTIISAVILSLMGTAGMQLLIYRMVDIGTRAGTPAEGKNRSLRIGFRYSLALAAALAAIFYPIYLNVLHFTAIDFGYFALMLTLYSLVWVILSILWAANQYLTPAIVFTFSYMAIIALSYSGNRISPEYTISGYAAGTLLLLVFSYIVYRGSLGQNYKKPDPADQPPLAKLISGNVWGILFQTFYVVAIFLDKLIVWLWQGLGSGNALVVTGPYSIGSFFGLIPVFCIAGAAYFTVRVTPLTERLYEGTLSQINLRIRHYKQLYFGCLEIIMIVWFVLFVIVSAYTYLAIGDNQVFRIFFTISIGSFFFAVIVFNATVLPLFHKTNISAIATLVVCITELASVLMVGSDIWYAALGFTLGSFIGFLVSQVEVARMFSDFQYRLFSVLASP